ncbi:MAG TPA: MurT ligase domain-containing protein [Mycobacteriales bacterium]|nr:MurT ligase domain-containing protein [Mycobacteriales bacterium]
MTSARYALGRAAGTTAAALSRLTGRGDGTTVGGRLTLAIAPDALALSAAGRELALVSGTNGKSTTRSFLVAALETLGPVASNAGGANLPTGLTAALTRDRRSPRGVLEVDEPFLPHVVDAVRPRAVTLLNLSRDQLDRYAEVRRLASIWRDSVGKPTGPTVIANCDDPLVTWAASDADRVVWVAAGQRWHDDTSVCPSCGGVLSRSGTDWSSSCGLRRPEPAWRTEGTTVVDAGGTRHEVRLGVPGVVNVGNAALAAATAALWGVAPDEAFAAMSAIRTVEGRYLSTTFHGSPVRLLLAKNPAGWTEALSMVPAQCRNVVISVNARAADGRDPSWLWDVPFEQLAGKRAVATGERSRDVSLRLRYAGVDCVRVDEPAAALAAATNDGPVEVLANYTAFQVYRRVVGDA